MDEENATPEEEEVVSEEEEAPVEELEMTPEEMEEMMSQPVTRAEMIAMISNLSQEIESVVLQVNTVLEQFAQADQALDVRVKSLEDNNPSKIYIP